MVERLKRAILGGFGFKEGNKKSLSLTSRKNFFCERVHSKTYILRCEKRIGMKS